KTPLCGHDGCTVDAEPQAGLTVVVGENTGLGAALGDAPLVKEIGRNSAGLRLNRTGDTQDQNLGDKEQNQACNAGHGGLLGMDTGTKTAPVNCAEAGRYLSEERRLSVQ